MNVDHDTLCAHFASRLVNVAAPQTTREEMIRVYFQTPMGIKDRDLFIGGMLAERTANDYSENEVARWDIEAAHFSIVGNVTNEYWNQLDKFDEEQALAAA